MRSAPSQNRVTSVRLCSNLRADEERIRVERWNARDPSTLLDAEKKGAKGLGFSKGRIVAYAHMHKMRNLFCFGVVQTGICGSGLLTPATQWYPGTRVFCHLERQKPKKN